MAVYNRDAAVTYAARWALSRNPAYLDFQQLGGDCTNFVSQCLYAGSGVMNFTPVYGWYYRTASNRTASWTGVEYLYRFLLANREAGPWAAETGPDGMRPGDVVQLGSGGRFTHAALVIRQEAGEIFVASHSSDAWMKPLSTYAQPQRRFLHIEGVRGVQPSSW